MKYSANAKTENTSQTLIGKSNVWKGGNNSRTNY